jgi:anti-sigma factor RsiW
MPTTEQKKLDDLGETFSRPGGILKDDRLAAAVSAYLDGQLMGEDLAEFESLLEKDESLAREVKEMRKIEVKLMEMGAEILSEPIPDTLIAALTRLNR